MAQNPVWQRQLDDGLAQMALKLDVSQRQQLLAFLALLAKWNKAFNLTAVRDEREMVSRHLLDSLSIVPSVTAQHLLDAGAGGGLPGVPLAITLPDTRFTLLDSNGKKIRFLKQCALELGLRNIDVVHSRAEAYQPRELFTQISSRAFAALDNQVNWCDHLLAGNGEFIAMKGQYPTDEVAALGRGWQVNSFYRLAVPGVEGERNVLIIGRHGHPH